MMQAGVGVVAGKNFELLRNPTNVGALPPHPLRICVKHSSFSV